jgi:hypothetical protein
MDIELATNNSKIARAPKPHAQRQRRRLAQPSPELSNHGRGDMLVPDLGVERSLAAPDVGLGGVDKLGALEDLPEDVEHEEDGDTDVGSEEGGELIRAPGADGEDLEAVEEDDQDEVDEGDPGRVWLEPALEDERVSIDALEHQGLAELDEGDADAAPGEEVGNRHQVLEPVEDGVCAGGNTHKGEMDAVMPTQ